MTCFFTQITTLNPTAEKSKSDPKTRGPVRRVGAAAAGKASSQAVISPNTFKNVVQDWEEEVDNTEGVMSTPSAKSLLPKNNSKATSAAQTPAAPVSTPSTGDSNSEARSSDEPDTETNQGKLIPKLRADAKVGPKGAKASDFEGIVRAMILRACAEFEARCCTRDAFPPLSERIIWAREAWESANRLAKVDYAFVDAVSKLVSHVYWPICLRLTSSFCRYEVVDRAFVEISSRTFVLSLPDVLDSRKGRPRRSSPTTVTSTRN